jgi:hypothetical protein
MKRIAVFGGLSVHDLPDRISAARAKPHPEPREGAGDQGGSPVGEPSMKLPQLHSILLVNKETSA